jgi:hypothetical protein
MALGVENLPRRIKEWKGYRKETERIGREKE